MEEILGVPNYPRVYAEKTIAIAKEKGIKGRVLDLGCAVGRTNFDLVDYFNEAVGIDISKAFINVANEYMEKKY